MPRSAKEGSIATTTKNGSVVFIAFTRSAPSDSYDTFRNIAYLIEEQCKFRYKLLFWSPHTEGDSKTFHWDYEGDGYQGLTET